MNTVYIHYAGFVLRKPWGPAQWIFISSITNNHYPSSNHFPCASLHVRELFSTASGSPAVVQITVTAPNPAYGSGMLNANVFQRAA